MTLIGNRKLKGGSVGGHKIKKIYCGLNTVFSSKLPVKPVLPSDTTAYPMHKTVNGVLMFAVRLGDKYGYYAPSTNTFSEETGMSGNYIELVEYILFDGTQYIDSGKKLHGNDVVRVEFETPRFYYQYFFGVHSKFYLYSESNGFRLGYNGVDRSLHSLSTNFKYTVIKDLDGLYLNGSKQFDIEQASFETETNAYVGYASDDPWGSAKFNGKIYSCNITGTTKANLVPVKIMNMYCMLDTDSWSIPAVTGTLSGGAVTGEDIPFPNVIY